MHFIKSITASLLLAGSALAQSGQVTVHVVAVSSADKNTLTFSPQNVVAQPGEMVQFQFHNGNHTVTQSTFANPCEPINDVMSNVTGFFSGFQAVTQGAQSIPTYTIMVNDTKPIWYYCSQGKHCQSGMVGAVNAATTGNKTVQAFAALAAQAPQNLAPGESPSGTSMSGSGSGYSMTSAVSAATSGAYSTGSGYTMTTSSVSTSTTSAASTVSSGAAAGNILANSQQVVSGGLLAALLSALLL